MQGPIGPFVDTQPKAWQETIETNLTGVLNCCRAVLPQMIERRKGKIIVITGGGAREGRLNFSLYAATKTALVRFVESVALEVSEHNVQINCLSPGGSYTHMTDQILAAGERVRALAGLGEETDGIETICPSGGRVLIPAASSKSRLVINVLKSMARISSSVRLALSPRLNSSILCKAIAMPFSSGNIKRRDDASLLYNRIPN